MFGHHHAGPQAAGRWRSASQVSAVRLCVLLWSTGWTPAGPLGCGRGPVHVVPGRLAWAIPLGRGGIDAPGNGGATSPPGSPRCVIWSSQTLRPSPNTHAPQPHVLTLIGGPVVVRLVRLQKRGSDLVSTVPGLAALGLVAISRRAPGSLSWPSRWWQRASRPPCASPPAWSRGWVAISAGVRLYVMPWQALVIRRALRAGFATAWVLLSPAQVRRLASPPSALHGIGGFPRAC